MSISITYHGHACFSISDANTNLLIDPFLTGNAMADVGPEAVEADYILVSHAHEDHLGDTVGIGKRTGATVITNAEIAAFARRQGLNAHAMQIGGEHGFPFGKVKLTIAHHGSSFADGSYGGLACGFLLWIGGKVIYHAGDTALTQDMALYADEQIDVAMLPIGDNYTMGPRDAIKAVELLRPQMVIPMHFSTFASIVQDGQAAADLISARTAVRSIVLQPGQVLNL